MESKIIENQKNICKKHEFNFELSPFNSKVAISLNVKGSTLPIHALRHPSTTNLTGWYIWSGDYSEDDDFFKPLHVSHLQEWCPFILPYLGLPAGTRFLIAEGGNYVDVWEDLTLLEVEE